MALRKKSLIDILSSEKTLSPAVEILLYKNYADRINEATTTNLSRGNKRQVFESESVPLEANATSMINADFEVNEAASSAHDVPDDSSDDNSLSYEAYVAFNHGMKMNRKTWSSLSQADQDTWDKISQQGKDTILRSCMTPCHNNTTGRPPDCPFRPTLPSALRNHEANVTKQHAALIPPIAAPCPSATREVNFYEQPAHVPTERPPDQVHLQVHRAEAILRASTDEVPADGSCICRLLSEPSKFAASSTA